VSRYCGGDVTQNISWVLLRGGDGGAGAASSQLPAATTRQRFFRFFAALCEAFRLLFLLNADEGSRCKCTSPWARVGVTDFVEISSWIARALQVLPMNTNRLGHCSSMYGLFVRRVCALSDSRRSLVFSPVEIPSH